jgi:RHS repeat-associated protein
VTSLPSFHRLVRLWEVYHLNPSLCIHLGSVTEALNQTGTATGSLLYGPYGGVRYTNGTMPTAKGFTGQYVDASTGLDYYGARYYDPALGQFMSADTIGGLNRYGYVAGNPETATDPTGHRLWTGGGDGSIPAPNDAGWRNNQDIIEEYAHRGRPPWPHVTTLIDPSRRRNPNAEQRRAYPMEAADAEILADYFGLDVIYRDPGTDYVIGVDSYKLTPGWPPVKYTSPTTGTLIGATTADLYYPKAPTNRNTVISHIRDKSTQAAIVVVDISDNRYLQSLEIDDELYLFGREMTSSGGNGQSGANRVIFIDNEHVVCDVSYTWSVGAVWGPFSAKQAGSTPGYYDSTPKQLNR